MNSRKNSRLDFSVSVGIFSHSFVCWTKSKDPLGGLQLNTEILQQEGRSFLRCFYYLDGNPESKQEEIEIEAKLEGIPNNTVEIAEKINAHPILGDIDIFVWDNATDDMIGDNCWKCVSWPKDESEVLMLEKKPPRL